MSFEINQKTIKEAVRFEGRGLHTGRNVHFVVKPAPPECGNRF